MIHWFVGARLSFNKFVVFQFLPLDPDVISESPDGQNEKHTGGCDAEISKPRVFKEWVVFGEQKFTPQGKTSDGETKGEPQSACDAFQFSHNFCTNGANLPEPR